MEFTINGLAIVLAASAMLAVVSARLVGLKAVRERIRDGKQDAARRP